jgi:hypothetical protein
MIGGHRITETTRAQARELLEAAQAEFKKESRKEAKPARKTKAAG